MLGKNKTKKKRVRKNVRKKPSPAIKRVRFVLKAMTGAFLLVASSSVFIFGYDFFTQTDHFAAKKITVEGESRLTRSQVLEQARVKPGDNILSVNLSVTRKRLVAHPWIQWASIQREIPGQIHIRIKEHCPLAILVIKEKQYLIDMDGRIFKEKSSSKAWGLPMVTGLDLMDISIDGAINPEHYEAVLRVLRLGNEKNSVIPTHTIRAIDVDRETGITVHPHKKSWVVKLGYGDYEKKYGTLRALLPGLKKTGFYARLTAIDVNDINRIVVTPAG